jgi:hypothetical protein
MLKRTERVTLGKITGSSNSDTTLQKLTESNPRSFDFNPGVGDSTRDIVNYMLALQRQSFNGHDITEQFRFTILQRNAKLLLKDYDPLTVKRGVALAAVNSPAPYSFAFVRKCIEQWLKESNMRTS